MRSWHCIPLLLIVIISSCSKNAVLLESSPENIGELSHVWYRVTTNDQTISYSILEDSDQFQIRLTSNDRMAMARIFALGMTVTFDSNNSKWHSVTYPTGIMETRSFIFYERMVDYWEDTKTLANWQARLARNKEIVQIDGFGYNDRFIKQDSLRELLSVSYRVSKNDFTYQLSIPITILETYALDLSSLKVGIRLGKLDINSHKLGKSAIDPLPQYLPETRLSEFTRQWGVWLKRSDLVW